MALSEHEKWIKENLGDMKIQVDSNALWESLQDHVPPKKKKRGFIFFFLGLLVAVGMVGVYYIQTDSNSTYVANPTKEGTETPSLAMSTENDTKSTNHNPTKINNSLNNIEENTVNPYTANTKTVVTNAELNTNENKPLNPLNSPNNQSILPVSTSAVISPNYYARVPNLQQASESENVVSSPTERATILYSELLKQDDLTPINNDFVTQVSVVVPATQAASKQLFLTLQFGGNYHFNKTTTVDGEAGLDVLRRDISQSMPGYFASVGAEYELTPKWSVYTSVMHAQLVYRTAYHFTTNEEQTNSEGIDQILIDQYGFQEEISGEVREYIHSQITGVWYNYTNHYTLQSGLKYRFFRQGRLNGQIGAGIDYKLSSRTRGSYLADDWTIEKIENALPSAFRNIQGHASVQINYQVNKNTSIGIQAQYMSSMHRILHKENTLISEFQIGNIGLSCRYGIH